jgi:hypothetical protein
MGTLGIGRRRPTVELAVSVFATLQQIRKGQQTVITWTTSTSCVKLEINGQVKPTNGSMEVYPTADYSYVAIAYDSTGNTRTAAVSVQVVDD